MLIVDDEAHVLQSLASTMASAGFDVTCAATLPQAVDAMQAQPFELILTDFYLGEMELGSQIADCAAQLQPRPPVVVLTGRPSFDGAQAALRSRVTDMVTKPVQPEVLLRTCERAIQETDLERRNNELESVNHVLATVLPRTIEMKDPTTSGHAERVVGYTDNLARRCGVSSEDRASLRLASLLHDVGKIGVPDSILTKPGPLTPDERDIVMRHPRMGYEVLKDLSDQENVRNWVYHHHERWDGRGYPQGLGGEDVALPGRILVLAEVFDALAEQRSYKPAWPTDKIANFFRAEAGRQFDPELANMVAAGLDREGVRFFSAQPGMLF